MGATYKKAGVDIHTGNRFVDQIGTYVKATYNARVVKNPDGYGGLYDFKPAPGSLFAKAFKQPLLVACTDGVGTKLKIAFMTGKHDTVGIDLVAMSVNDLVVQGAEPLFFLDYIVTDKLKLPVHVQVLKGISDGCKQAGCALLGGETAEHPGAFPKDEYDLAGFAVGVVEKSRLILGKSIKPGDVVLGLPSSGLHSNGFSLVRNILFARNKLKVGKRIQEFGKTLGEELLTPTLVYVKPILSALAKAGKETWIKGLAHITGGGIIENIPRILPGNCDAVLDKKSIPRPRIFDFIQKMGKVHEKEMYLVYNMGLGMAVVVPNAKVDLLRSALKKAGQASFVAGEIRKGGGTVKLL